jgi:hypothetical protein
VGQKINKDFAICDDVEHPKYGLGTICGVTKKFKVCIFFYNYNGNVITHDFDILELKNMFNLTDINSICYKQNEGLKLNLNLSNQVKIRDKKIDSESKDIRQKWVANNLCDDGHYVRSISEMVIDNWLYNNGYLHAYEKKVFMASNPDETVLCDFYLPEGNVYLEFWGKDDDSYNMRRARKLKLYNDNRHNVISIEADEIKIIGDILQRKIFDYIKK